MLQPNTPLVLLHVSTKQQAPHLFFPSLLQLHIHKQGHGYTANSPA
jgi:hypothetical protein